MANLTSGKYGTIAVTRNQIIRDALEDLRVLMGGKDPKIHEIQTAEFKLNLMLKVLPTRGQFLWCVDHLAVPMQPGKRQYTLGVNGDVALAYRPLRVLDGAVVRVSSNGVNTDTPLNVLSRKEYDMMPSKDSRGVPNSLYYDPQMGTGQYDPAQGRGVLYVWVEPQDNSRTVILPVQRPIQEMINGDDAFDVPPEWYFALQKMLVLELADKYEVPEDRMQRYERRAEDAISRITDWAVQDEAPLQFTPDWRFGMTGY